MKDNQSASDLIIKSLKNSLSDTEKEAFAEWVTVPENGRLYRKASAVWKDAVEKASSACPDDNKAWRKISSLIDAMSRRRYRRIVAVAASIAAVLISGFSIYVVSDLKHEKTTADISFSNIAGKTVISLPDGSEVWLRSGAKLSSGKDFGKRTRTVNLSGEAFFDVAKDPSKPFRINISGLGIEVLGTSFGVKDCSDRVIVNLVEGTVRIVSGCIKEADFSDPEKVSRVIVSGETACCYKSGGGISIAKGDPEYQSLWARNRISFRNDDMETVCGRLSVWYGTVIHVSEDIGSKAKLTFTVTDEPLDKILSLICKASPGLRYRYMEDGSVLIEG